MKELHATVAALVYARVCTEPESVWDRSPPMEKALKAADDFVAGYMTEMSAREPVPSVEFIESLPGVPKIGFSGVVFDPTVTKKKPTPAEVVEDIKAKRRAAKGAT